MGCPTSSPLLLHWVRSLSIGVTEHLNQLLRHWVDEIRTQSSIESTLTHSQAHTVRQKVQNLLLSPFRLIYNCWKKIVLDVICVECILWNFSILENCINSRMESFPDQILIDKKYYTNLRQFQWVILWYKQCFGLSLHYFFSLNLNLGCSNAPMGICPRSHTHTHSI